MATADSPVDASPSCQPRNMILFSDLVHSVDPAMTKEWKRSVPVFVLDGTMVFAVVAFKAHTKYNFIANGADTVDNDGLFNARRDFKWSCTIDLKEDETVGEGRLRSLVSESIERLRARSHSKL